MNASNALCGKPMGFKNKVFFWAISAVFFFGIMLCAPYTYDDFEFASLKLDNFSQLLQYCLSYGNGRILGNIFGVLGNQIPVVSAFCKAIVLASAVILIPEVLGQRSILGYLLSFLLTITVDPALFAQVITWNSGFHNYVPPVFLMLCALWLIQHYPKTAGFSLRKAALCILLFLLGLSSQLYIEHSSVINVALAFVVVVKAFYDKRGMQLPALCLFIGTCVGLALMFWIPTYFLAAANDHTTGYRSLYINSIGAFVFNCARNALRLANHYFGMSGVPLCAGAAISVYLTKDSRSEKLNSILYSCSIVPGIYMVVCSLLNYEGWYAEPAIIHHAIAMAAVMVSLFVWIVALFSDKDALFRNRVLTLLALAVFSLAPLLIVTPIRIRVVYHSQFFIVLAFLLCFLRWSSGWKQTVCQTVTKVSFICALVLMVSMASVFVSIRQMDQARHKYILQQMEAGSQVIDYFRIPYDLVHDYTDPLMGKYYYINEPYDVEFNIKTFDEWMNDHLDSVK